MINTGMIGNSAYPVTKYYGEMYLDDNSDATVIETANTPIMIRHAVAGSLKGFSFGSSSTGAIIAYSNGTGKVNINSTDHGLDTDDNISIRGSSNYKGIWTVTKIDDNNFSIPATWVSDDGASDWDEGSHLIAGSGTTGTYKVIFSSSCSEGGAAGSNVIIQGYANSTACLKCLGKRKFANNDYGALSGASIIPITEGDKLYTTMRSDGTNSLTCQYGNFNISQL